MRSELLTALALLALFAAVALAVGGRTRRADAARGLERDGGLAGSVSTRERPWPAIAAALVVPAAGAAFMLWRRLSRRLPRASAAE